MPTYEYECEACGHAMEEWQSITAAPLKKCPECGKKKLKRLFGTGGAIIFKGSGFYITDYRSDSYQKAEKADKPPTSDSSDKSPSTPAASESPKDSSKTTASDSPKPAAKSEKKGRTKK